MCLSLNLKQLKSILHSRSMINYDLKKNIKYFGNISVLADSWDRKCHSVYPSRDLNTGT